MSEIIKNVRLEGFTFLFSFPTFTRICFNNLCKSAETSQEVRRELITMSVLIKNEFNVDSQFQSVFREFLIFVFHIVVLLIS